MVKVGDFVEISKYNLYVICDIKYDEFFICSLQNDVMTSLNDERYKGADLKFIPRDEMVITYGWPVNLEDYMMDGSEVGDYESYHRAAEGLGKETLELKFEVPDIGYGGLSGWIDSRIDSLIIENFEVNPEGKGLGRKILKYLKERLEQLNILLEVSMDQVDEAKGFWDKMYEEEILN